MNISLPEPLREFVEERVRGKGYGSSSEDVRELIRNDQVLHQRRDLPLSLSEPD